ncbi:hypothetical protein O0L34_g19107 [Tuta absoluta]|nr:hypothetical protein O0L34_g19107 [Tuta absoluta]
MGDREIQFHSLNKDELEYEVTIQSETPTTTVSGLRKELRILLLECPSVEIVETEFDPESEVKAVEKKLRELEELLQFPGKQTARIKALAYHLFHRCNRIKPEEVTTRGKLRTFCDSLTAKLVKVEQACGGSGSGSGAREENSNCTTGENSEAKWNIRFNGLTDGVSDSKLLNSVARLFVDQAFFFFSKLPTESQQMGKILKGHLGMLPR